MGLMSESVAAVLLHRLNPDELFSIERSDDPGFQDWIPLDLTDSAVERFVGYPAAGDLTLSDVAVVGDPTEAAPITLGRAPNTAGWRMLAQARHGSAGRHPAWSDQRGFPSGPSDLKEANRDTIPDPSATQIILVRTTTAKVYAHFVNARQPPEGWPSALWLRGSVRTAVLSFDTGAGDADVVTTRAIDALEQGSNLLIYGPPGTGKTRLLRSLWELASGKPTHLELNPDVTERPFEARYHGLFGGDVARAWVTFHQSTTYEDVVIGRRPEPGPRLQPQAGVLLDLAARIDREVTPGRTETQAVLFVDELNRANVSRALGEFITFMDDDYRRGEGQLPVPLGRLRVSHGETEPVELVDGTNVSFPVPWYFPKRFRFIASMNSVDRAAAPLDSALARRFVKLELAPDLEVLADWLGIDDTDVLLRAVRDGDASSVTWGGIAWLLLHRVNNYLALTFGSDFELGHAQLLRVRESDESQRPRSIAEAWESRILPQLTERLASRPEQLADLLRLDGAPPAYLYQRVEAPPDLDGGIYEGFALKRVSLVRSYGSDPEVVESTLRRLAGFEN
jgi:hypothetical protein